MSDRRPETPIERTPAEARQAEKSGVVRYVLAASLTLVVIVFAIIYFVA
jgi:hypothetical protein